MATKTCKIAGLYWPRFSGRGIGWGRGKEGRYWLRDFWGGDAETVFKE